MNCIFTCVFNNKKYIDMFYLLLESIYIYGNLDDNTDILLYTSSEFMNVIKKSHLYNKKIKFEKVKKVFHVTSTNFPEIKKVFTSTFLKLNVQPFDVRVEFRLSEGCLKGTNAFYCLPYFWLFK